MTLDPLHTGGRVAELFLAHALGLFDELERSSLWRSTGVRDRANAEREWEAFALYACVRGLVAGAGSNRETGDALDVMHEAVLEHSRREHPWARRRPAT